MKDDLISRRVIFHELLVYGGKVCPDNDVDGFPITINVRDIKKAIINAPEVKPPERHGKWIYQEPDDKFSWKPYLCSACGEKGSKNYTEFCPHCGALMDGKDGKSDG